MRAVVVTKPGTMEIIDVPQPKPGPYQALVKTEVACLCNLTDRKLIEGHFPGIDDYPLALGHETAGIVTETGSRVCNFRQGERAIGGLVLSFPGSDLASAWGGFCEYTLVNDHEAMVEDGVAEENQGWREVYEIQRQVDSDIPPEAAVLLCTWREVYAAFTDFHLEAGQDVLIFGSGPVGLSFARFGRLLGLDWIGVVDPHPNKREKALALGADEVFERDSPEIAQLLSRRGKPVDAVIDAVGKNQIINTALPLIGLGGSICVYGVLAESSITVANTTGPYNFNLYIHQWPTRVLEREAQEPLCEWIREGSIDPADLITHEFPVERITEAMEMARSGKAIKILLRY